MYAKFEVRTRKTDGVNSAHVDGIACSMQPYEHGLPAKYFFKTAVSD
jgi:hypothetical protein